MTQQTPPPPYQQPPAVPPGYELKRRKRRKWPWLLGVLAAIVVIIVVSTSHGGSSGISPGSGGSSGGSAGTDTIVYSVTSDASSISATYTTFSGGSMAQAQDNSAAPPWSKTVTAKRSWVTSDSLVAQMNPAAGGSGKDGTTITCTITVNGKQVAKQTSTGQYATVTCDAS